MKKVQRCIKLGKIKWKEQTLIIWKREFSTTESPGGQKAIRSSIMRCISLGSIQLGF